MLRLAVLNAGIFAQLERFKAPKWLFRTVACFVLGGQVILRIFKGTPQAVHSASSCNGSRVAWWCITHAAALASLAGNIHWRNTAEQLRLVGPASLGVSLLTAGFVGMVFTIQARSARPRSFPPGSHIQPAAQPPPRHSTRPPSSRSPHASPTPMKLDTTGVPSQPSSSRSSSVSLPSWA
jgi:hypothetical protein